MARDTVDLGDAVTAVLLVDAARLDASIVDVNPLQDLTQNDPDGYFQSLSETLLTKLNIKR